MSKMRMLSIEFEIIFQILVVKLRNLTPKIAGILSCYGRIKIFVHRLS